MTAGSDVDVAVVGAGPAGLSAAMAAASAGALTLLLDENDRPGGQLCYRLIELPDDVGKSATGPDYAEHLADQAKHAGVQIELNSRVWGLFAGLELGVERDDRSLTVRPARVILATGSVDRSLPFPGTSLPGVFTARAIQLLLNRDLVLPGRRFAVIGDGREAQEVARDVVVAGGEAVVTVSADTLDMVVRGYDGVTQLEIAGQVHSVDIVVVAAGRIADASLAMMAGCESGHAKEPFGTAPRVNERLETSVPGLFVAGDCAGPCDIETSFVEGRYAGACAAASLGLVGDHDFERARQAYLDATGERSTQLSSRPATFVPAHLELAGKVDGGSRLK